MINCILNVHSVYLIFNIVPSPDHDYGPVIGCTVNQ